MVNRYTVLDTNLLLEDPKALTSFIPENSDDTNTVVIPLSVLRELDKFKGERNTGRGYNANRALKKIKELSQSSGSNMYEGIRVQDNYFLQSSACLEEKFSEHDPMIGDVHDKDLLRVAKYLHEQHDNVSLITNDTGVYDIAGSLGMDVRTWEKFELGEEEPYKGWRYVEIDRETFDKFDENKKLDPTEIGIEDLQPNEFVIFHGFQVPETPSIRDQNGDLTRLFFYENRLLTDKQLSPRNPLQQCYMHALRDPNIDLVFSIGEAGTSKTFLATDAGIELCFSNYGCDDRLGKLNDINPHYRELIKSKKLDEGYVYSKFMLTRPVMNEELGSLPGNLEEKMEPWLAAVQDQFKQLWKSYNITDDQVESFKENKTLDILATHHMRGRSLPNVFWIIDEAQNAYHSEFYTALTRCGENSKVVMTGDPTQCDLKGMNAVTNPIVWFNERFKDSNNTATIYFDRSEFCERGRLAQHTIEKLGSYFNGKSD